MSGISSETSPVLTVTQMYEDIDFYFSTLKDVHPRLYAKYTESQFDSLQSSFKKECSLPMERVRFKYLIAKANHFLDEHSGVCVSKEKESPCLLPWLDFKEEGIFWDDKKVYFINGVSLQDIQKNFNQIFNWSLHPKQKQMDMNLLFPDYLEDNYGLSSPYIVGVCESGDEEDVITCFNTDVNNYCWNIPSSYNPQYHSKDVSQRFFPEDGIAVFYYNTSVLNKINIPKYKDKYILELACENFFEEVKKQNIQYVFIDVSENSGGSDLAHNYLGKYLKSYDVNMDVSFHITQKGYLFLEEEYGEFKEYKTIFKKWKKISKKGFFKTTHKVKGNKSGFDGKVYSIMSYKTASAAFDFCRSFKYLKSGWLVGEAAGQRSPYSGNMIILTLPNSEINFSIGTTFAVLEPDITGIDCFLQPDIPYSMERPLELQDLKNIIRLSEEMNKNTW